MVLLMNNFILIKKEAIYDSSIECMNISSNEIEFENVWNFKLEKLITLCRKNTLGQKSGI